MDTKYTTLRASLAPRYGEREAQAIALLVLEEAFGVGRTDVYADKVRHFSAEEEQEWADICERLVTGEPVQYVLGRANFCMKTYCVTPATLIPRIETEGLVSLALRWAEASPLPRPLRVLDVGTGSGCIAIELAYALQSAARVEAWDISPDALAVAQRNAQRLGANVEFKQVDLFDAVKALEQEPHQKLSLKNNQAAEQKFNSTSDQERIQTFDLIVSNPPYVRESERAEMEEHVLAHEPATALFVPDDDPQRFYRALARLAVSCLAPGGLLAVEANRALTADTATLFERAGLTAPTVHPDCFSAPRFVTAVRSE